MGVLLEWTNVPLVTYSCRRMHTYSSHTLRIAALLCVITLCASQSNAQVVADPNAIELRPYVTILDPADSNRSTARMFNLGDLDGDGYDDLLTPVYFTDDTGRTTTHLIIEHPSATSVRSRDTLEGFSASLIADWDGDGRNDIFDIEAPGGFYRYWLHPGIAQKPYFGPIRALYTKPDIRPLIVTDFTGDGIPDMISSYSQKIYLYAGPLTTVDTLVPVDSINLKVDEAYTYLVGTYYGQFKPGGRKQLLTLSSENLQGSDWKWAITARLYPPIDASTLLWNATPDVVYTDTVHIPLFVYSPPATVGDFSGDRLDDLLIGDSAHVYVFNGGPNFGARIAHNTDADLTLTSPHMIAPSKYHPMSFPESITFLGDITGSGTPFIGVEASTNQDTVGTLTTFFYAGGAALDPYYDATLTWSNWQRSLLMPVQSGPLSALVFTNQTPAGIELDLLRDGLQSMPHIQRSSVLNTAIMPNALTLEMLPIGDMRVAVPDDATSLRVYNAIGELMEALPLHGGECTVQTRSWPRGAYVVIVQGKTASFAHFIR